MTAVEPTRIDCCHVTESVHNVMGQHTTGLWLEQEPHLQMQTLDYQSLPAYRGSSLFRTLRTPIHQQKVAYLILDKTLSDCSLFPYYFWLRQYITCHL